MRSVRSLEHFVRHFAMTRIGVMLVLAIVIVSALGFVVRTLADGTVRSAPQKNLQSIIDATPDGEVLYLEPGVYAGPVTITRPIEIDGGGGAVIDAGGRGSVITLQANGATLRGLRLINSGENHDTVDAAIQMRGNENRILNNVIEDCLFGIDLQRSNRNLIQGNQIRSKAFSLGLRGDAIRLWSSNHNQVIENTLHDVRDLVVWYSADNTISRNSISQARYGLHFMYAQHNLVEENHFRDNSVGVFLMFSDGVVLRRNRIERSSGPTGIGLGFKETSGVSVEENLILLCSTGIFLDLSPLQPDMDNRFTFNRIGYNGVGVIFHNDWSGNEFSDNEFKGNFVPVAVNGSGSAMRNVWQNNYWDDYQGFDRDHNDRGDSPYELYAYADQMWMDIPSTGFFRGSPLFEVIQFLDRLAPFSQPKLVLRDETPRFSFAERMP